MRVLNAEKMEEPHHFIQSVEKCDGIRYRTSSSSLLANFDFLLGLKFEGLFRVSGSQAAINAMRAKIDKGVIFGGGQGES